MLQEKINEAINFLRRAEKLALKINPEGFYLAFSGGKDSCVIYQLAKMAGVKFKAFYNVTTIDPPELVLFIKNNYPDVIFSRPRYTFLQLIKKRKFLPLRTRRFCCEELKENKSGGWCSIVGVRAAESVRRKKQASEVKIFSGRKKPTLKKLKQMEKTNFQCVGGKDSVVIAPILTWTDKNIWDFIKLEKVPFCNLYNEGYKRLGCLFCPMARPYNRIRDVKRYPKFFNNIRKAVATFFPDIQKKTGFKSVDDYLKWWLSDLSIKKWKIDNYQQLTLNF